MVHRLQNRNVRYGDNVANTLTNNQATLNATEGATALNLNNSVEEENVLHQTQQQEETKNEPSLENISIENATYLQNLENTSNEKDSASDENMETFEVDSIELATPELFSDFNQDNNKTEPAIFESTETEEEKKEKGPEMFEETNMEEDFEIPAFLRRQKN